MYTAVGYTGNAGRIFARQRQQVRHNWRIPAFRPGKKWWLIGALAVLSSYLIASYYMVVAGWTLEYLVESITGGLYEGVSDTSNLEGVFTAKMDEYIATDLRPLLYTYALIAINIGVLLGGVSGGIERLSNIMMPLLFVILAVMCVVSLMLPGASEGVKYFLAPDFSKINGATIINAPWPGDYSASASAWVYLSHSHHIILPMPGSPRLRSR